jgi:hypothetical protein
MARQETHAVHADVWLLAVQAQEIVVVGHHYPACSLGVGQELGIGRAE